MHHYREHLARQVVCNVNIVDTSDKNIPIIVIHAASSAL